MTTYRYWAEDPTGKPITGTIDAEDLKSAAVQLAARGIHPRRLRHERGLLGRTVFGETVIGRAMRTLFGDRAIDATVSYLRPPTVPQPELPTLPADQLNSIPEFEDEPAFDRIEDAINNAGIGYGFGTLIEQVDVVLARFALDDLQLHERESYFVQRVTAADMAGERDEAFKRASGAFRLMPDSARVRLLMARQYESANQLPEAFTLLDDSEFWRANPRHAPAAAQLAYLWDEYELAQRFLAPAFDALINAIEAREPIDLRVMPGLGTLLWSAAAIGAMREDQSQLMNWLTRVDSVPGMDDESLELWLEGHDADDFKKLIEHSGARLAFTDGMESLQATILTALTSDDPAGASQMLGAAGLPAHREDLQVVRMIALLELAHRAAESDRPSGDERIAALTDQILHKAPMLLPPEMISYFNLFEPIERLKKEYREQRIA
ncbi:MAG TPA: hypothetical protein PK402_07120 [Tepidisphaeraceae bacterium]|nr:hypothetical protein [Tepidisphaeraceae bacterium]